MWMSTWYWKPVRRANVLSTPATPGTCAATARTSAMCASAGIVSTSAIVASHVLSGEMEVGRAIQAAGAFAAVLNALTVIVDNFEELARFVAGLDRLDTFAGTLANKPAAPDKPAEPAPAIESVQDSRLSLLHVTLRTPNLERTLVRDLTIKHGWATVLVTHHADDIAAIADRVYVLAGGMLRAER